MLPCSSSSRSCSCSKRSCYSSRTRLHRCTRTGCAGGSCSAARRSAATARSASRRTHRRYTVADDWGTHFVIGFLIPNRSITNLQYEDPFRRYSNRWRERQQHCKEVTVSYFIYFSAIFSYFFSAFYKPCVKKPSVFHYEIKFERSSRILGTHSPRDLSGYIHRCVYCTRYERTIKFPSLTHSCSTSETYPKERIVTIYFECFSFSMSFQELKAQVATLLAENASLRQVSL